MFAITLKVVVYITSFVGNYFQVPFMFIMIKNNNSVSLARIKTFCTLQYFKP